MPCLNVQKIWVKSGLERNGRNGPKSGSKAKKVQNPQKYVKIGYFWHFLSKLHTCGQIWMNWHQMSFLAHFWLFLGQFGHSGSPAWARMTVPLGSTHTKNTFKCPRHLHRQKKSQKTNYFRSKPRLAKNWLKTWLKLAKNATDQKTDLTCRTGSLCHFQKWSYFLF